MNKMTDSALSFLKFANPLAGLTTKVIGSSGAEAAVQSYEPGGPELPTGLRLDTEYFFCPLTLDRINGLKYIDTNVKDCNHCRRIAPTNNIYQATVMFINSAVQPAGSMITTTTPFAILVMFNVYDDAKVHSGPSSSVYNKESVQVPKHQAMWLFNGKGEDKYEMIPYEDSETRDDFDTRGQFFALRTTNENPVFAFLQIVHSQPQVFGLSPDKDYYGPAYGDRTSDFLSVYVSAPNNELYPGLSLLANPDIKAEMFGNKPPRQALGALPAEISAPAPYHFSDHWWWYVVVGGAYLSVLGLAVFLGFIFISSRSPIGRALI